MITSFRVLLSSLIFVFPVVAMALPPLGLTQIKQDADPFALLAVIDDMAYVSTPDDVFPISSQGLEESITLATDSFGSTFFIRRVVADLSGDLHVAAAYSVGGNHGKSGSSLFRLDAPTTPVVEWNDIFIFGIDRGLKGIGAIPNLGGSDAFRLSLDGTFEAIPSHWIFSEDITPNGIIGGESRVPGTAGSAPSILNPDNTVEFLASLGVFGSVRDRLDGEGFNVGFTPGPPQVRYGDSPPITISHRLSPQWPDDEVIVSESDFTVLFHSNLGEHSVYYPGIVPTDPEYAIPLVDLFPELLTVDLGEVLDISSHGGQIHLLFSGDDGLWLFAAPDPTVVPEPSAILTVLLAGLSFLHWRPRNPRKWRYS